MHSKRRIHSVNNIYRHFGKLLQILFFSTGSIAHGDPGKFVFIFTVKFHLLKSVKQYCPQVFKWKGGNVGM